MAVIKQQSDYKTVVGWYGECQTDNNDNFIECDDLSLSIFRQYISSAFRWTSDGVLKSWKSNLPDSVNARVFDKFQCGGLYYLTIKPGTGEFTIPGFKVSTYETNNLGLLTDSCNAPLPTPTPQSCSCAPDDFMAVEIDSGSVTFDSHTFSAFHEGSTVYYDNTRFDRGVASFVSLRFWNGVLAGTIIFTGLKPNNCPIYLKYGDKCYTATATSSNVNAGGSWELMLNHVETLPSGCGDRIEIPTPTPVAVPTPTPVDCVCVDDPSYESFVVTSSSFTHNKHMFQKFTENSVISYNPASLGTSTSAMIVVKYEGNPHESIITLTGKRPTSSTRFYLKHGIDCYSGTCVEKTGFFELFFIKRKELSSECGDKIEFPTPTPVSEPDPTPTPTPVDCECINDASYQDVVITNSSSVNQNNHIFQKFTENSVLSYNPSSFTTAISSMIVASYEGSPHQSVITLTGKRPTSSTRFYLKQGIDCYSGTCVERTGFFELFFIKRQTLSSKCGDKVDFPTPTPVNKPEPTPTPTPQPQPTPTPQPQPTPTPTPVAGWNEPSTHTRVVTNGSGSESVFTKNVNGTTKILFTWRGFSNGGKLYVDINSTSFQLDDLTTTKKVVKENGEVIGTVKKFLQNGNDRNDIYYVDPDGTVYRGTINNDSTSVFISVIAKLENLVCCDTSSESLGIQNGSSPTVNNIGVKAISSGEMDGKLCWPRRDGFTSPTSYLVKFSDLDQSASSKFSIMITATTNIDGATFRYERDAGGCYEGKLSGDVSIFTRI